MKSFDAAAYSQNLQKKIHAQISNDFKKIAKDMVTYFYKSRYPLYYDRTNNYKDNVKITKTKSKFCGGINVSSSGMHDYVRSANSHHEKPEGGNIEGDYVFDLIWNQGIRGLPLTGKDGWLNPHFMQTFYTIPEYGISAKSPDEIMTQMCEVWVDKRKDVIDQIIEEENDALLMELFS